MSAAEKTIRAAPRVRNASERFMRFPKRYTEIAKTNVAATPSAAPISGPPVPVASTIAKVKTMASSDSRAMA